MKMAHGPLPTGSEYLYIRYDIIRPGKHCLSRLASPVIGGEDWGDLHNPEQGAKHQDPIAYTQVD